MVVARPSKAMQSAKKDSNGIETRRHIADTCDESFDQAVKIARRIADDSWGEDRSLAQVPET
jgi:hypothetical protein